MIGEHGLNLYVNGFPNALLMVTTVNKEYLFWIKQFPYLGSDSLSSDVRSIILPFDNLTLHADNLVGTSWIVLHDNNNTNNKYFAIHIF